MLKGDGGKGYYIHVHSFSQLLRLQGIKALLMSSSLIFDLFTVFEFHRFKGYDMLAPFTAGWQTTDLNPLVIERSEV